MVDQRTSALGHVGVAITFGLVIMAMIYAVGHVSGAHFNPAVTFSFALSRHFPRRQVPLYWAAQLAGALDCGRDPARFTRQRRARRSDLPERLCGASLPLGSDPLLLPDVRDHGRRDRHAGSWRSGRNRDRRHRRPGRHVRRPDHRRVDEPRPFARSGIVAGDLRAIWVYLLAPILGAAIAALAYTFIRGETLEGLAEAAGDVVVRAAVGRVREDLRGRVELDQRARCGGPPPRRG